MLTAFFYCRGVVHYEFLPTSQAVNKGYYLSDLSRLLEAIGRQRPEMWQENSWVLHYDNEPSHSAIIIREFLNKYSTNTVPHAPYSPDMAPCDFLWFTRLKLPLRGRRFESISSIKENSLRTLKGFHINDIMACFDD
ncbi:hypothetical protein AVEN_53129-1 [Araneus ventricosus]|uniref:Mariner Mos1 transposase n=1 Tax=Araneus ventricosus TaxID=182803 RepID=A0A4Y2J7D8_ARAVE|nr:hypothetical protein AVEN_53129-1 [Araneus ventricosus]